jgi:DNA-binding NarL/FixJ family response regulator
MELEKHLTRMNHVLILDTEEKLLKAIKNYFSSKNINVSIASNPMTASNELNKNLPDCLVIDIAMTNNWGLQFIQEIKKNKKFQHIPFILLTARGLTEDRISGYNLGCSAYVCKPFDPEELESIIKNIISKNDNLFEFILKTYILLRRNRVHLSSKYKKYLQTAPDPQLTKQEQFILQEILKDKKLNEIALALSVSNRNVERYLTRILDKTKFNNLQELKFSSWFLT